MGKRSINEILDGEVVVFGQLEEYRLRDALREAREVLKWSIEHRPIILLDDKDVQLLKKWGRRLEIRDIDPNITD